ncbi:CRTAC1 family protein [Paraglaciecola aquimarina]|uniref:CRTAC1 family protein n=1 Tax=Paraglaciecola algarum TaxID=3050085 RepID=A0ABS9D497_9ALTE|nr:CRTAC1 family protein [Paraglaciecola sp. G1-23]MCF2947464.1 CRTAC1 family protein [Paraglaciecola sp. G1-23]
MFKIKLLTYFFIGISSIGSIGLSGCTNNGVKNSSQFANKNATLLTTPVVLTNDVHHSVTYQSLGSSTKRISITATIDKNYANLSIYADGKVIADNLDLPKKGKQTINVLVDLASSGTKELVFKGRSAEITLHNITIEDVEGIQLPTFIDNSKAANLDTESTYKYGGPSIGDIDNDGDYDFVLNNHNKVPTQLVTNLGNGQLSIKRLFNGAPDLHGSALGDYDLDGDLDIILAHGGANGTSPSSYTLFKNTDMTFENVSGKVGIQTPARGRAPRWIDLDLDGDLDLALFNAKTPNYDGPQTLFLDNQGNGTFEEVRIADIEKLNVEKPLVVDFDRDGKDDLLLYYPDKLSLWKNNGDFTFTNVSKKWLPSQIAQLENINGATDVDVNNDGLVDLYLANGRSHYSISNKSLDFSPNSKKLDVNDNGEKGVTQIEFTADGNIHLADVKLVFRQYRDGFPIFLGKDKQQTYIQPLDFNRNDNRYPAEQENAPFELDFAPDQAQGWPEQRAESGLYIGYLGDKKWKAEWVRNKTIYWGVEFSLTGLNNVDYDWPANNRNIQDVLLINKGTHFEDAGQEWNIPKGGNHWGVSRADFNNDGWQDLFVHRYGYLRERIADLLLLNTGKGFEIVTSHGAFDPADTGHGDMGQAFDFNNDGLLDMLNGSESTGKWYLYLNQANKAGNYIQFHVGYSPKQGIDPLSAEVTIETIDGKTFFQTVGSTGEVHSQSVINTVHFGLAQRNKIKSAKIVWRNGEEKSFGSLKANALYKSE